MTTIQEKINKLKSESEMAEALLLENINSISTSKIIRSFANNKNDFSNSLSVITGPNLLSLAKVIFNISTALSSTSKVSTRLQSFISLLK